MLENFPPNEVRIRLEKNRRVFYLRRSFHIRRTLSLLGNRSKLSILDLKFLFNRV